MVRWGLAVPQVERATLAAGPGLWPAPAPCFPRWRDPRDQVRRSQRAQLTGEAIFSVKGFQRPLEQAAALADEAVPEACGGYASCPLAAARGRVILVEFVYGGKVTPSFPFDPRREWLSLWWLKKHFLPLLYWNAMLKGPTEASRTNRARR